MGFNQRRIDRERAAAQRAEKERRERERGRDVAQARKLVAILEQPGRPRRPAVLSTRRWKP
jgi:hypothetical protein